MHNDLENMIRAFVAEQTATKIDRINLDTSLLKDLGVDGADGWELIKAFGIEFKVDLNGFDPIRHFGHEAGCCPPVALFNMIRSLFMEFHQAVGLSPITIQHLVESAKAGEWRANGGRKGQLFGGSQPRRRCPPDSGLCTSKCAFSA